MNRHAFKDKAMFKFSQPCIPLYLTIPRFLDCSIRLSKIYTQVLDCIREGWTLLDLGCCFGHTYKGSIRCGNIFSHEPDLRGYRG